MRSPLPYVSSTSSPTEPLRSQLVIMLGDAGVELLSALGVVAEHGGVFDPTQAVWSDPLSFIGFAGSDVAGNLLVSAPWPLMARTSPVDDHRPEALADWSRELCNMTLGVLKVALVRRGLELQIGLPTSVVSSDLRVKTSSRDPIGQSFDCGGQMLLIALDCVVRTGLVLTEPRLVAPELSNDDFLLF